MTRLRTRLTRRQVLAGAAALAAAPACGPGGRTLDPQPYDEAVRTHFAPLAVAEDAARFPLGTQAGAMTALSALLWTHARPSGPLRLRVWRERFGTPAEVMLVEDADLEPGAEGYLKVRVEGLAPATWYHFAFFNSGLTARSSVGRFRTAFPYDWAEPLTIGATACTKAAYMPFRTLELQAKQPQDLFVHLGDQSYNDGAVLLSEYREKWRRALADPGYRALYGSVGLYAVWDDHEVVNNFEGETVNPEQLANAKQAYFETLAVDDSEGRLWRSYRWGKTAEIFMLDCRSERRPSTRETAHAEYISSAQYAWLTGALEASPCHFKVLLNSVPITRWPPPLWGNQADRWQGYPAQREGLLDFIIDRGIENVVSLSGDFHLGAVARVEKEGPRRRIWEVLAGPGGNGNNPLAILLEPGADPANRELAFPRAQIPFASGALSATTVTLDPRRGTLRVRFLDPDTGEARYDAELAPEA